MTRARAQGPPQGSNQMQDVLLDHQALYLEPSGKMRVFNMSDAGVTAVKRHGHRMRAGRALFYREAGNNYMLGDEKMTNGSMLFDQMHDWGS
jgi:hypothetical protein